jgi:hypothetical protein
MSAPKQQTVFESLRERIPDELIRTRQQGGANIRFIEWHSATELLDERAPGWECRITEVGHIAGKVFIKVALTIDGVTRENIGFEDEDASGYGDVFSNSFAMAVKRAAALFGLARHLYDKDEKRQYARGNQQRPAQPQQQRPQPQATQPAPRAESRPAQTSTDEVPVTDQQVSAITRIGKAKEIDIHAESMKMYNRAVTNLSRSQASEFIIWLQGAGL